MSGQVGIPIRIREAYVAFLNSHCVLLELPLTKCLANAQAHCKPPSQLVSIIALVS
jgi:hypothetical protein